jgi:uncharacterized Zn finger protein
VEGTKLETHREVIDAAVAAGCVENGRTEGSHCGDCGKVLRAQEEIPAIGSHQYDLDPGKDPTCTEEGLTVGSSCHACGFVHLAQEVISPKGHAEVTDAAVPPSCTATGLTAGSHCSVCGTVTAAQETVPMTDHTPVSVPAVEATCSAHGLSEGINCGQCGKVLTAQQETPKKNHTVVIDHPKAPTCTEPGLDGTGMHCSQCGTILLAQQELPATGHTFSDAAFTWAEDLTSAAAVLTCPCGQQESVDCTITWSADKGSLRAEAEGEYRGQRFTDSRVISAAAEGDRVTLTLPEGMSGVRIFVAAYDERGRMTDCLIPRIKNGTVTLPVSGHRVRIMLLTEKGFRVLPMFPL